MKSNPSHRRTWSMALGLATALLAAMWWLPDHAGREGDYGPGRSIADSEAADPGTGAGRPARRLRASSTMPYFSFAQSLRSRG